MTDTIDQHRRDADKTRDRIVDLALSFTSRPTPEAFKALDEMCTKLVTDDEAEYKRRKAEGKRNG